MYKLKLHGHTSISWIRRIKGVGESAANHIEETRSQKGIFTSIEDFCFKINLSIVNSGTIESLIASGSFDSIVNESRSTIISNLSELISYGHKKQTDLAAGQNELFATESDKNKSLLIENNLHKLKVTNAELKHEEKYWDIIYKPSNAIISK